MDLQDVDICSQPSNARIHGGEDVFSRQAHAIDHVSIINRHLCKDLGLAQALELVGIGKSAEHFRHDDDPFAGDVVFLECATDDALGGAVGVDVRLWTPMVNVVKVMKGMLRDVRYPMY